MKDGAAVGPFGVMGAFMQPQGHVLVAVNTVDYHLNPQAALDAPRFQWTGGKHVQLEREVPAHIAQELARRGHEVEIVNSNLHMGRGQIIWKTDNGLYIGGTEPRCDGAIAAWGGFAGVSPCGSSFFLDAQKEAKEAPGGGDNRIRLRLILHDPHPLDPHLREPQLGHLSNHRKGAGSSADWFPFYNRCR